MNENEFVLGRKFTWLEHLKIPSLWVVLALPMAVVLLWGPTMPKPWTYLAI